MVESVDSLPKFPRTRTPAIIPLTADFVLLFVNHVPNLDRIWTLGQCHYTQDHRSTISLSESIS